MSNIYNKEIDALRAFSIFAVFFYHLDSNTFPLGYLGVDVFFVISGFVISKSLYKKYENEKKINILNFYLRRIKRLYPALLFFLIIHNILFGLFYPYGDAEFRENFISSIFSFFGVSNFYFYNNPFFEYFNNFHLPTIHTWSLSIEEQFYFIFPFILFFVFRFFKKNPIINFLIFASILFLLSFSAFLLQKNLNYFFYISPFRFWEILFGVLIFFMKEGNFFINKKFVFKNLELILIFSLFLTLLLFGDNLKITMIVTVLITGLFIYFYDKENSFKFVFENKILIYFGKISYSFYLWHLPIIFYLKVLNLNIYFLFLLSFLIASFISIFSYEFIEKKMRYSTILDNGLKNFIKIYFLSTTLFILLILLNNNIYRNTVNNIFKFSNYANYVFFKYNFSKQSISSRLKDNWIGRYDSCHNSLEEFGWWYSIPNCIIFKSNNNFNSIILGESYADHITPLIVNSIKNSNVYRYRFESCYFFKNSTTQNCPENYNYLYSKLINKFNDNNSLIFFSIRLNNKDLDFEKIGQFINKLSTYKIIMFAPLPENSKDYKDCNLNNLTKTNCEKLYSQNFQNRERFLNYFKDKNFNNLRIFDFYEVICDFNECRFYNEKDTLYRFISDGHHFTHEQMVFLKDKFSKWFYKD
tara:strand:+ start:5641 stop:7563 length:1923 start_codon:yes stop_codon:yes gene_type:complete